MLRQKPYEELTFADDFMFCKVLENNEYICKKLVELILGVKVRKVVVTNKQKVIDITPNGKSIRLDVYLEDDKNTVYDLEMQTTRQKDIAKRTRYYQGMIDLNQIERGARYSELRKTFIVFICMDDPFKEGLPVYSFRNVCREKPQIELKDDSEKVFVNAACRSDSIPNTLKNFFGYLRTGIAKDVFTSVIDDDVAKAREHKEWKVDYMTLLMKEQQAYDQGLEQGKNIGIYNALYSLASENIITFSQAAERVGISEEEFLRRMEEFKEK